MEHFHLHKIQVSTKITAFCRSLIIACIGVFVTYTALRAIEESWNNESFPEVLAIKLELMPVIFPLHMITGGLALLLVPLALYLRHTKWHKIVGRIASTDIFISGLTALPVALAYPVTHFSAAGFATQAIVWMLFLGFGIWHILNGRAQQHRNCMLLMTSVMSGAIFFRVFLASWKFLGAKEYFTTFYALNAWIAWCLPLLAMMLFLKFTKAKPEE